MILETEEGCDSIVTLLLTIDEVGIDDISSSLNDLFIYPNPTMGQITISAEAVLKVAVYDARGVEVAVFDNTRVIDLSPYSSGAYLLRITLPEGKTLRRVIKK